MSNYSFELPKKFRRADQWRRWSKPLIAAGVGGLIVLIGVFSAYYTVAPEGKAVVKRFGRVVDVVEPGLHFKLPFGIDAAYLVPTERVLKEEFGFRSVDAGDRTRYDKGMAHEEESLMLTGDLNVIDVEWVVQYRISDPVKWLHEVRDQEQTIRDVSESVMRRIVGNRLGADVLTTARVSIASEVREEMQTILDEYQLGVHVSSVELQDVTPPDPVKPAFNAVNESRQQKERLINIAEKERNQVIPRATGEAEQTISEARAYAAERVNVARGETDRFTAILQEYRQAEGVTRRRLFLEMIDEVLPGIGKLYVMEKGGVPALPLLRLDESPARVPQGGER